jgi:hypothetical protein
MTRIPLHPLLFAVLPVLTMFAANPGQRLPHELPDALRVVVCAVGLLLLVVAAVYRDVRKAALWVSALVLVMLAFDSLYSAVENVSIGGWRPGGRRYVLPLTYLALGAWAVWLYRRQAPPARLTGFANMLALGAILPPAVILGIMNRSPVPETTATTDRIAAGTVTAKPDIYYLIFDRYGDEQTARAYGLENDIDEYLTDKGFYVAGASRSNYIKTVLSLSSSLNTEYLDEVVRGREQSSDWFPVYRHLWGHRVGAFFRSQGYTYTHLGSWYYPTSENPQATRNVNYYTVVPRKVLQLLDSVVFSPLERAVPSPWLNERLQNWHRVRRQVEDVLRLVPTPGPKFVLFHVLVPHPPYVFDRDLSYVTKDQERKRSFAENYTNQTLAANAMIRRLVDGILRDSPSPPVIIVQGDEGPYPPGTMADTFDWRTASAEQLRVRSGILNAYHLPGVDTRVLYPSISPVNSFRVVFNTYFGTNLPLLPDRTIRHVSDMKPFAFDDITGQVAPRMHASR